MVNSYDEMMGSDMDPMDHPAYGGHDDNHTPGRAGMQVAGDIVDGPLGGTGSDSRATEYATGIKKDPKILSIGKPALQGWVDRTKTRLGK